MYERKARERMEADRILYNMGELKYVVLLRKASHELLAVEEISTRKRQILIKYLLCCISKALL
jgi:hypothetical protein